MPYSPLPYSPKQHYVKSAQKGKNGGSCSVIQRLTREQIIGQYFEGDTASVNNGPLFKLKQIIIPLTTTRHLMVIPIAYDAPLNGSPHYLELRLIVHCYIMKA